MLFLFLLCPTHITYKSIKNLAKSFKELIIMIIIIHEKNGERGGGYKDISNHFLYIDKPPRNTNTWTQTDK